LIRQLVFVSGREGVGVLRVAVSGQHSLPHQSVHARLQSTRLREHPGRLFALRKSHSKFFMSQSAFN